MKKLLIAILIASIVNGYFLFLLSNPDVPFGSFTAASGQLYLTTTPIQATTTVGADKTGVGNPSTLVSENTGRANIVIVPDQDIYIWLTNSTSGAMTNGGAGNSDGILIASGTKWDMEDHGIIWPGTIYALASSTTSTVQYTEFVEY